MNLYNLFEAPKRTPAPGTTGVMDNQVQSAASPIGSGTSDWESKKRPVTMMGVGNNGVVAEARDVQLDEISNAILGSYKKAASADASAADRRGDIERGDKRFKGIVRATIKQGENDAKKHKEQGVAEGVRTESAELAKQYGWAYNQGEYGASMTHPKHGRISLSSPVTSRSGDTAVEREWTHNNASGIGDRSLAQHLQSLKEQGVAEGSDKECPPATQDIKLNLKNRQKAIDEYGYGPLNPDMPNRKFWMAKVDEWNLDSAEEAKQSLCGNCAAFDQRKHTLDCIAQGIDSNSPNDAEGVIDAGDLGYCKFLKFKCASRRTCDAWVTGGPLTDKQGVAEGMGRATPKMPKARDPGHAVLAAKRSSGAAGQHTNKRRQAVLQPKHQKPLTRDMDMNEDIERHLMQMRRAGYNIK